MNRCCPVCSHEVFAEIYAYSMELPEKFHLTEDYTIVSCEKCGFIYQNFDLSCSDYDWYYSECNMYADVPQHLLKDTQNNEILSLISRHIEKTQKILDIGSGSGDLLEALSVAEYEYLTAMDPSEVTIDLLEKKNIHSILNSVYQFMPSLEKQFDLVMLTGVVEHLLYPKEAIETVLRYVKETGFLLVCVPDLSFLSESSIPFCCVFQQEHINQFSRNTMCNFLSQFSFQEIDYIQLPVKENAESSYFALFRKSLNHCDILKKNLSDRGLIQDFIEISLVHFHKIADELKKNKENRQKFIIWGCGSMCYHLIRLVGLTSSDVLAIVDKNTTKHGSILLQHPIQSPSMIAEITEPYTLFICVNSKIATKKILEEFRCMNDTSNVISFFDDLDVI